MFNCPSTKMSFFLGTLGLVLHCGNGNWYSDDSDDRKGHDNKGLAHEKGAAFAVIERRVREQKRKGRRTGTKEG